MLCASAEALSKIICCLSGGLPYFYCLHNNRARRQIAALAPVIFSVLRELIGVKPEMFRDAGCNRMCYTEVLHH